MLQAKAVLIQWSLRSIPTGDGQSTVQVGDSRAAVYHADSHGIAQIFKRQHHRHGQVGVAAVGAEVGNGVVRQLTDDLPHAVEIVADAGKQAVAGGVILDDCLPDRGLLFVIHSSKSFRIFQVGGAALTAHGCRQASHRTSPPVRRR